ASLTGGDEGPERLGSDGDADGAYDSLAGYRADRRDHQAGHLDGERNGVDEFEELEDVGNVGSASVQAHDTKGGHQGGQSVGAELGARMAPGLRPGCYSRAMVRRTFGAGVLVSMCLLSHTASADVSSCVAASEQAQLLRDKGRYHDARAQLLVCGREGC